MQAQLSHKEAKTLFLAAVDDDLAEQDQERLRSHLDECAQCREGWERYTRTINRLGNVQRERAPKHLATLINRRVRRRRVFTRRDLHLAYAQYRVPVEAIIPLLIGVLVAAFLVLSAP